MIVTCFYFLVTCCNDDAITFIALLNTCRRPRFIILPGMVGGECSRQENHDQCNIYLVNMNMEYIKLITAKVENFVVWKIWLNSHLSLEYENIHVRM